MYYLTLDKARAAELKTPPYSNLASYLRYKSRPPTTEDDEQ